MSKNKSTILPAKSKSKGVVKIAERNIAKKTAEIKEKIKAKQQSVKKPAPVKKASPVKRASSVKKAKNAASVPPVKLLITIVGRNKAEYYLDLIQSFDVNMQCVLLGHGTADKSTLGLLGLTDSDKAVIVSVIQEKKASEALSCLNDKFGAIKGGKGVACVLPISSVIGVLIYGFLSNNRETVKEAANGKQ